MTPLLARIHTDWPGNPLVIATDGWFGVASDAFTKLIVSFALGIMQQTTQEIGIKRSVIEFEA